MEDIGSQLARDHSLLEHNGSYPVSWQLPNRKARINTYGDSFTECEQVGDGQTWQEYLAGHLGEPVRNFGWVDMESIRPIGG